MSQRVDEAQRRAAEIRDVLHSISGAVRELSNSTAEVLEPDLSAALAQPFEASLPPSPPPAAERAPGPGLSTELRAIEEELRSASASLLAFAERAEEAARGVAEGRVLGHRLRAAATNAALASSRDSAAEDPVVATLRDELERASHEIDHLVASFARALEELPAAVRRSIMSFENLAARLASDSHPGAVPYPTAEEVQRRQTERAASELIALGKRLRALVRPDPERDPAP